MLHYIVCYAWLLSNNVGVYGMLKTQFCFKTLTSIQNRKYATIHSIAKFYRGQYLATDNWHGFACKISLYIWFISQFRNKVTNLTFSGIDELCISWQMTIWTIYVLQQQLRFARCRKNICKGHFENKSKSISSTSRVFFILCLASVLPFWTTFLKFKWCIDQF